MAQYNWIYRSEHGHRHDIGVFHGDSTGHLMIYCNAQVVQIDFNVNESKTYPLFLEDELCEIRLEKQGNRFNYNFLINRDADTPKNRLKKQIQEKEKKHTYWFVGGFLSIIIALSIFFNYKHKKRNAAVPLTASNSQTTWAKTKITDSRNNQLTIEYSFIAGNKPIHITERFNLPLDGNPLPLPTEGEFALQYHTEGPYNCKLNFSQPSEQTITTYIKTVSTQLMDQQAGLDLSQITCRVRSAYDFRKLDALADILYNKRSPEQYPTHNSDSYLRLVRDPDFQKIEHKNCY